MSSADDLVRDLARADWKHDVRCWFCDAPAMRDTTDTHDLTPHDPSCVWVRSLLWVRDHG